MERRSAGGINRTGLGFYRAKIHTVKLKEKTAKRRLFLRKQID
jgi:hypothetical protein